MNARDYASLCEQYYRMLNYGLIAIFPERRYICLNKTFYKCFNTWYYDKDSNGTRIAIRKESFYDKDTKGRIQYTFVTYYDESGKML